jgi:hypothetical protein
MSIHNNFSNGFGYVLSKVMIDNEARIGDILILKKFD